ncbi:hypothetical protein [Dietzia kunjamensis]|uniref:hypothetical protein n=1 Tax=Dietzia kunjamensis TaxID=322509 RepID=UPI002097AA68|nr:hypothetical protein [Dietzia kunjamensis]USX46801.1 hypothetical protein NHB83_04855 [Dietzia kunjamensis]
MSAVVAIVTKDQFDRGDVERDWQNQYMAVRALPENDEVIEHMFGDLVVKGGDSDAYEWRILPHLNAGWYPPAFRYGAYKGAAQQDVQRGDWMILSVFGLIYGSHPSKFEAEWVITGSVSKPRVSEAISPDHLPPKSEWQKPNIDNLPPKSEWPKIYWKENQ